MEKSELFFPKASILLKTVIYEEYNFTINAMKYNEYNGVTLQWDAEYKRISETCFSDEKEGRRIEKNSRCFTTDRPVI